MNRSIFREHCFKMLFDMDFYPDIEKKEQIDLYFEQEKEDIISKEGNIEILHNVDFDEFDKLEARQMIEDCISKLDEIDEKLKSVIVGWNFERMGKVERAILRLGYYEIKYVDKVPNAVAINEAVNLAKKFASNESSGFINAILAKVV